jgi:hypothetical protein
LPHHLFGMLAGGNVVAYPSQDRCDVELVLATVKYEVVVGVLGLRQPGEDCVTNAERFAGLRVAYARVPAGGLESQLRRGARDAGEPATTAAVVTYLRLHRDRARVVLFARRHVLADREADDKDLMIAADSLRNYAGDYPDDIYDHQAGHVADVPS